MGDLTKDFSRKEFACKCGCGFDDIDTRLVHMAQKIRDLLGEPVRVNSACRCAKHNKAVGGVDGSYHTKGLAADLSCASGGQKLYHKIKYLYQAGALDGLEYCKRYIKGNFVHIDIGRKRTNRFEEGN